MTLTADELAIIDATVPIVRKCGSTVTETFYKNLLNDAPSLKNVFNLTNQRNGRQPAALANALLLYAINIRNPANLSHFVEVVCHKHASLGVERSQYDIVGKYLLDAFREVLGDAFTAEVESAWLHAYQELADIMAGREEQLYRESPVDWQGWHPMKIIRKVSESPDVVSLYLGHVDGQTPLPTFNPGQYVSVKVVVDPTTGLEQPRQYSMSLAPNARYYRISPKAVPHHENSSESGEISRILHAKKKEGDLLHVSFPRGEFCLSESVKVTTPIVLVSAGIGITPMLSMLHDQRLNANEVHFVHVTRNASEHAFADEVIHRVKELPRGTASFYYSEGGELPTAHDGQRISFHHGRPMFSGENVKLQPLALHTPATLYYICGPEGFMSSLRDQLEKLGVDSGRIFSEVFNVTIA